MANTLEIGDTLIIMTTKSGAPLKRVVYVGDNKATVEINRQVSGWVVDDDKHRNQPLTEQQIAYWISNK